MEECVNDQMTSNQTHSARQNMHTRAIDGSRIFTDFHDAVNKIVREEKCFTTLGAQSTSSVEQRHGKQRNQMQFPDNVPFLPQTATNALCHNARLLDPQGVPPIQRIETQATTGARTQKSIIPEGTGGT